MTRAAAAELPSSLTDARATAPALSRAPAAAPASRLFILAGQSNMVGRGRPQDLNCGNLERLQSAAEHVLMRWDLDANFGEAAVSDGWRPLQVQYSPGRGEEHFGPEITLAESLWQGGQAPSGGKIYLAKFAMGSTQIAVHWCPGGGDTHYARFVKFCQDALASAPQPCELGGIFWFQGESDASKNKDANEYEDRLVELMSSLRKDLKAPSLPIVASQVFFPGKKKILPKVNAAIERACAPSGLLGNAVCCTMGQDPPPSVWEDGHLDSAAVLERGAAMAAKYLSASFHRP